MTTRLYVGDPYCSSFTARVLDGDRCSLVLDQSCFYGPDGLFPSDRGWIAGRRVVGLRCSEVGMLLHLVAPPRSPDRSLPEVGDRVECEIDWTARHRAMCLHTAQHLVELGAGETNALAAVDRPPAGLTEASVDLTFETSKVDVGAIVQWFTDVVGDDLSMGSIEAPAPPHGRLWYLDGYGHRRCGAPHPHTTGELTGLELDAAIVDTARLRVTLRAPDAGFGAQMGTSSP